MVSFFFSLVSDRVSAASENQREDRPQPPPAATATGVQLLGAGTAVKILKERFHDLEYYNYDDLKIP